MSINSILSTSLPSGEDSKILLIDAVEKQKHDLEKILISCQTKLHHDFSDMVEFTKSIDTNQKISPALFLYVQSLRDAVETNSITAIMDAIQGIHWLSSYGIYEPKLRISSILSEYWEIPYVNAMRHYEQKNICGETSIVRPISSEQVKFHAANIKTALAMISLADPEVFSEIEVLVSSIKLFQGRVLRGQSSGNALGAIWIRIPDKHDDQVGYWIEHIVHEVSHTKLHAMFFQEKFVLNSKDEKKFKAPIRDDLRPMLGIFHATFVLSRMVRVFRLLSFKGYAARFRDRLQLCKLQFDIGIETVYAKDAKLTENGKAIRGSFKQCAFITEN